MIKLWREICFELYRDFWDEFGVIQFLKDEFYSSVTSISRGVFNITEPYLGRTKNLIRKAVVAISEKK